MALKAAEWVHGTIVDVEWPDQLAPVSIDGIARKGWGTHFWGKEDTHNWFHIPITTPVILDGIRPKLTKLFVFYQTKGNSKILHLHLYDGKKKIKSYNNLNRSGDHNTALDSSNTWVLSTPKTIYYGLGISVCVSFGKKSNNNWPEVIFSTAGADYKNI